MNFNAVFNKLRYPITVAVLSTSMVAAAVMRIHLRVQTTLIGYEIGRLKTTESQLLEARSTLNMHFAKMTTKRHLQQLVTTDTSVGTGDEAYALK